MLLDKLSRAVEDLLSSDEFKGLLERKLLEIFGNLSQAQLKIDEQNQSSTDTVVMPQDWNLTPDGLAFNFRSRLSRRPNSQEGLSDVTAQFEDLIRQGFKPELILEAIKVRGRSAVPIWEFVKQLTTKPEIKSVVTSEASRQRALETLAKLQARG